MQIVDAQVHLWSQGTPPPGHRKVPRFTAQDLLKEMDEGGIDRAILHPPLGWDPDSNEIAVDAARRYPERFAVLGQFQPDKPESRERMRDWMKQPGMLGLRFPLHMPQQANWHKDGTLDWLWPAAEREGIPVALLAGRFLPEFTPIAERHPGLKLIIDHCGVVHTRQGAPALVHLDELIRLARLPHVAVKVTGVPQYSGEAYPFRIMHEPLHRIYDAYGPERMFWGTDLTGMPCSYRECVRLFTEELPWLKGRDLELVMGQAVCNWLDWK